MYKMQYHDESHTDQLCDLSKQTFREECQHMFCKKCIITYLNRDCNMSIQLVKLGQKQLVSEYLGLRSSPNQTSADFFHQGGCTASLFHMCNVSIDGRLQPGTVAMNDKLRKYCNSNQGQVNFC